MTDTPAPNRPTDRHPVRVTALRDTHGWGLYVEGIGVTQIGHLNNADQAVRDYVHATLGWPRATMDVELTVPPKEILDTPLAEGNSADAATVGDYLIRLLTELWTQEGDFSSRYPFGSSGWQHEIYTPLIQTGIVAGRPDGHGGWTFDEATADRLILAAIRSLGGAR